MAAESKKAVIAAIIGNAAIAVIKFVAGSMTGSSAMISEGIHSLVDTGNGGLLFHGLRRGARPADEHHPFGHGMEVYFWSLIVAVSIFGIGGGMSIYEGIIHIQHPAPLENPTDQLHRPGAGHGLRVASRSAWRGGPFAGSEDRAGRSPPSITARIPASSPCSSRTRRRCSACVVAFIGVLLSHQLQHAGARRLGLGGHRPHPRLRRRLARLREQEPAGRRGGRPGARGRHSRDRAGRPGGDRPRGRPHDAPRPGRRAAEHRGAVHAGSAGGGDPHRRAPHRGAHHRPVPRGEPDLHRGRGIEERPAGTNRP